MGLFDQQQAPQGSFNPYLQSNNQAALPGMDYGTLGQYGGNVQLPGSGGDGGGFNWGMNPESMGMIGQGLGGLTSLAQIYGMFQNLGMQKKAFKFAREGTKRNFNASATAFNNSITQRENANTAYQAANPSGQYGSLQSYGKVDKWT